jgi:hypothetical protein
MGLTCSLHEFHLSSFAMVDQHEMDGNHLILRCSLHDPRNVFKFQALIDCGTTNYAFIDKDYTHLHHLPLHLLTSPKNLIMIDG